MKIKVIITLKEGVLDPQGKAIQQTLNSMNFPQVKSVRQAKYCLLYTSPSPRDLSTSRMPSSA